MNYFTATTIVGWQTRNSKRHQKALVWCKDYGLKEVLPNLHIGSLYSKEEKSLLKKFNQEFSRKTDKVFSLKVCKSCYETAGLDESTKEKLEALPDFELVQMPILLTPKAKKTKKPNK